jgi:hypothetical protein
VCGAGRSWRREVVAPGAEDAVPRHKILRDAPVLLAEHYPGITLLGDVFVGACVDTMCCQRLQCRRRSALHRETTKLLRQRGRLWPNYYRDRRRVPRLYQRGRHWPSYYQHRQRLPHIIDASGSGRHPVRPQHEVRGAHDDTQRFTPLTRTCEVPHLHW